MQRPTGSSWLHPHGDNLWGVIFFAEKYTRVNFLTNLMSVTMESTGWIFGGRILANVKASGARSEDQKVIGRIIVI